LTILFKDLIRQTESIIDNLGESIMEKSQQKLFIIELFQQQQNESLEKLTEILLKCKEKNVEINEKCWTKLNDLNNGKGINKEIFAEHWTAVSEQIMREMTTPANQNQHIEEIVQDISHPSVQTTEVLTISHTETENLTLTVPKKADND